MPTEVPQASLLPLAFVVGRTVLGKMDSLFEQARDVRLERATMRGSLTGKLRLNLRFDLNGNSQMAPPFQFMPYPHPPSPPPAHPSFLKNQSHANRATTLNAPGSSNK